MSFVHKTSRALLFVVAACFIAIPLLAQNPPGWFGVKGGGGGLSTGAADGAYLRLDGANVMAASVNLEDASNVAGLVWNGSKRLVEQGADGLTLTSPILTIDVNSQIDLDVGSGAIMIEGDNVDRWEIDPVGQVWTSQSVSGGDAWVFDTNNVLSSGSLFQVLEQGALKLEVNSAGELLPGTTNQRSLGSTTNRWLNQHWSGSDYSGVQGRWNGSAVDGNPVWKWNATYAHTTGNLYEWQEVGAIMHAMGPAGKWISHLSDDGVDAAYTWETNATVVNEPHTDWDNNGTTLISLSDTGHLSPGGAGQILGSNAQDWGTLKVQVLTRNTVASGIRLDSDLYPDSAARTLGNSTVGFGGIYTDTLLVDNLAGEDNNRVTMIDPLQHDVRIGAAPTAPVTCDSSAVGTTFYIDDTNDSKPGGLCLCISIGIANPANTWAWLDLSTNGSCP